MISRKKLIIFILIIVPFYTVLSQSNKEVAKELNTEAVKLMDQGEVDKSLELLLKASELDPENIDHPYEMALAYHINKSYAKSIEILESIKNSPNATDLVYVQLGNSYDMNGNREKAFETYQIGIDSFPNSGKFNQELGNIAYAEEEYNKAISFWKDGIKANPNYSTNYYKLAKIFSFTKEKIWTLLYGEQFILLQPGTRRTEEISKLLFQTYQEIHDVETDYTSIDLLTDKGFMILMENPNDTTRINIRQGPFEGVYAYSFLASSVHFKDKVDFASITEARNTFLHFWFNVEESYKSYQIDLFDYQKSMQKNGVFDAYTFWLLSQGNPEEFQTWYNQNEEKVSEFATWFDKNRLQINKDNFSSRNDSK